ncbi:para-aminobenzoate synthase subunit I [Flammeovirgaceae bacterium 311]|nr:para-aminobenzoate synthase subunit I [Flammeovirgaceae bacterium 311]
MRQQKQYAIPPDQIQHFAELALQWAMQQEEYIAYYSSCGISYAYGSFPQLLAIGASQLIEPDDAPFEVLLQQHRQQPDWYFGYFAYELKNQIHRLKSENPGRLSQPPCAFFRPKHLLHFNQEGVLIESAENPQLLLEAIFATTLAHLRPAKNASLQAGMHKEEYLQKVNKIQEHIQEGDCYELNMCMEFRADDYSEDPLLLFRLLTSASPAPFTCFQRFKDQYLISASPERFLKKEKSLLISQPIKGTIRRGLSSAEDSQLRQQLADSEKDRAENLMIVDLVRNDLARSCSWGSVAVPELFGIYSFRQVHQMISTVTGTLRPSVPFTEAIRAAFPMGSMTGAPKHIVMELIDLYENVQRGLYSGAAGFISPAEDFDFNVVIRSMLYDASKKRLSFSVGGAITWDSVPEEEYNECLLKARAMLEILGAKTGQE